MSRTKGCIGCANNLGGTYCTMQKDMKRAQYVKCEGFKLIPPRPKKIHSENYLRKRAKIGVKEDSYFASDFLRFINKGGFWSARTDTFTSQEDTDGTTK